MSRKVLAVIDSDPILREACDRILDRKKMAKQKLEFIEKQLENAIKEMHAQNENDEGLIEARLKEIGKHSSQTTSSRSQRTPSSKSKPRPRDQGRNFSLPLWR